MNEKKDEFKEWVVSTFDKEAEQELRRLQEKEEKFEVPEGVKEAVFERLQEQLRERNERNASRQEVEEDGNIVSRQNTEENDPNAMDNAPATAEPAMQDGSTRIGSAAANGIAPSVINASPIIKFVGPASLSDFVNLSLNNSVASAIAHGGVIPPIITADMIS